MPVLAKKEISFSKTRAKLKHIKTIGSFAFIFGILGQLIGLYQVFGVIQEIGDVAPALLMAGLKVSMIATFYGFFIYMLSLLIWIIADYITVQKME